LVVRNAPDELTLKKTAFYAMATAEFGSKSALTHTLGIFREQCTQVLAAAIRVSFPQFSAAIQRLNVPPNMDFGELSSSIAYDIASQTGRTPHDAAKEIVSKISLSEFPLVANVEENSGYINFRLNYGLAGEQILESALRDQSHYGIVKIDDPARIAVEHTSANPIGPLTMGTARNSILGDSLARLLSARGHEVMRRFYIDDAGRQVSILAYGYRLLKEPEPNGKADEWFGRLYACVNCALEIQEAKRKLKTLGESQAEADDRQALQRSLDEWVAIATELESAEPELFRRVLKAVQSEPNPDQAIQDLNKRYEQKDPEVVRLVRKVVQMCLDGMKSTLVGLAIEFDAWDWESDLVWQGRVDKIVADLRKLPFTHIHDRSLSLDVNAILDAYDLRKQFGLSPDYEVPPLTLVRSDGTTLYPTRDIAYSLLKMEKSERVINVIAIEQALPQLQIRLALYALGLKEAALGLIHYAYGLVELPGMKMSKRRQRYITLNEVMRQAKARVKEIVSGREAAFTGDELEKVVNDIAVGAVKFAMLNINSTKNIMFTWDRVLSLERNSAPFINYAYTRAASILRKLGDMPKQWDASLLTHPLERLLLFKIGQLPDVFCESADSLKPEELSGHANSIAEKFHEYYEKVDVIHASEQIKNSRAALVRAVQIVLRNSMSLLGINVSERM